MCGTRALKGFGLPALTVMLALALSPNANAATEPAHQCFQLTPYGDTVRLMRVTSDYTPGMVGLFVRWRAGSSYQVLGSGVRTSHLSGTTKDISFSGVKQDTGALFAFTAVFDPATTTGPWNIFDHAGGAVASGTLTKISCSMAGFWASPADGEAGTGGPSILR